VHYLISDAICLLLQQVTGLSDFEFGLNRRPAGRIKTKDLKPFGAAEGMDRYFVEIPRRRSLTDGDVCSSTLTFMRAERVSSDARALRLKPRRRLIVDVR
jgi:hypothetical protein